MRVQAINDVAKIVQRDAEAVALEHSSKVTPEEGVSGDRIVTVVKVPTAGVVVTDGAVKVNQQLVVMALHARHAGWLILKHRLALTDAVTGAVLKATAWPDGPWAGDSVLSDEFDPNLPPEANAA